VDVVRCLIHLRKAGVEVRLDHRYRASLAGAQVERVIDLGQALDRLTPRPSRRTCSASLLLLIGQDIHRSVYDSNYVNLIWLDVIDDSV
jgi:uncharacterized protein YqfA (UPF0365 family)